MTKTKIEKLMAIKEEFARTQARLAEVRKLEESAKPQGMSALLENDLEQAELVLAAQDIMHKLQDMAEDLAKMNAQDLFPLVDKMKVAFGQEAAHSFEESAQDVITNAMNTVRHAKDELGNSIMRLEGKLPASDMAADANMDTGADMSAPADNAFDADSQATDGDVDAAMDSFGSADAAAGPDDEPLGRAKKESVEPKRAPLKESIILEAAGKKLIETEGLESLIGWVLAEAAAGMPEEHFRSFATSIATKAAKDPAKLAGWIGKKKHGMAAMAQLATPTYTQSPNLEIVESIEEGKTFRKGDDEDYEKAEKFSARKNARKAKQKGDDLEEGKTFRHNDDEDYEKADRMKARQSARRQKQKGEDHVDEARVAARQVAKMIEASIVRTGKGNAAKYVREFANLMASKAGLMEGADDCQKWLIEGFEAEFGMKPAAYSVLKLREATPPLSSLDQKNASSAMAKMASKLAGDTSAAGQSVQSAMSGMDGSERSIATKMLNTMKSNGQNPTNAGEFVQNAASMIDGDDAKNDADGDSDNSSTNGTTGTSGTTGTVKGPAEMGEGLEENINAAHWPIDSAGQYKGEPFQTDYMKLKPNPKGAAKTEGGEKAPEPKADEVKGSKAPEAKAPASKKPAKKQAGNPFAKEEEPAEEPATEEADDSEK